MSKSRPPSEEPDGAYRLDAQIGFLLRKANQRHLTIFNGAIGELTPRQFAALAKLAELGPISQNSLGRATAMDAATIKGVIGRLSTRDLVTTEADPNDRRRLIVCLTEAGRSLIEACLPRAEQISRATLEPLTPGEARQLLALIEKLT